MASTIVIVMVFLLNLIAFGLAVAAEQRRSTVSPMILPHLFTIQKFNLDFKHTSTPTLRSNTITVYDSDRSTGYGVGSFLFLLASQMLITVVSKCFCCGKAVHPGGSRAWAIILFLFCWVTFFIAEICLVAGSVTNAYHTKYRTFFGEDPPSCQTVRKGVFAAGAAFVFFTGILTELYYICYSKAMDSIFSSSGEENVEMMINYK